MTIQFKITRRLQDKVLRDLSRPHPFACERVGFISCKPAASRNGLIILAGEYHAVADEDYLPDQLVGAMMGPGAIRKALQFAYNHRVSMFHVHAHDHTGIPRFSTTDLRESTKFVPDFFNVQPNLPHGALILSRDSGIARCWYGSTELPIWISKITVVGSPMTFIHALWQQKDSSDKIS
jgi:hypothetical protein